MAAADVAETKLEEAMRGCPGTAMPTGPQSGGRCRSKLDAYLLMPAAAQCQLAQQVNRPDPLVGRPCPDMCCVCNPLLRKGVKAISRSSLRRNNTKMDAIALWAFDGRFVRMGKTPAARRFQSGGGVWDIKTHRRGGQFGAAAPGKTAAA